MLRSLIALTLSLAVATAAFTPKAEAGGKGLAIGLGVGMLLSHGMHQQQRRHAEQRRRAAARERAIARKRAAAAAAERRAAQQRIAAQRKAEARRLAARKAAAQRQIAQEQAEEVVEDVAIIDPPLPEQKVVAQADASDIVTGSTVAATPAVAKSEPSEIAAAPELGCKKFIPSANLTISVVCED